VEWTTKLWRRSHERFESFVTAWTAPLGRLERRIAASQYVQGLIIPGQRKSVAPLAERMGTDAQRIQQFLCDSPWDATQLWKIIRSDIIPHFGTIEAWIVDETGWVKQGTHSVGVSHQYCGAVGKQANCQVCVEIAVSNGELAAPIAAELYLSKGWIEDEERCRKAGVPENTRFRTKLEIAIDLIRQAVKDEVSPAPVLADAHYGDGYEFRQCLKELGLEFLLQVSQREHKAWLTEVNRKNLEQADEPETLLEIAKSLPKAEYKTTRWRNAAGKELATRIAKKEVFLQKGLKEVGRAERLWLVVDWPKDHSEPYQIYLGHFRKSPPTALCLRLGRSRFHIEQYFQRSKSDLGFDHYEGRSWQGFHHHLVLTTLAYLFILQEHQYAKKNFCSLVGEGDGGDPDLSTAINRWLPLL
jgi:SRSO17 transposase